MENTQLEKQKTENYQASTAPIGQLKTNRGLIKFILLSIVTLGIYSIVVLSGVSTDINVIASRYDGKKLCMPVLLFLFLTDLHSALQL